MLIGFFEKFPTGDSGGPLWGNRCGGDSFPEFSGGEKALSTGF